MTNGEIPAVRRRMLFSSCLFLFLFLPIVLIAYFMAKKIVWRNFVLLLASLFFYSWGELSYCWVMLAVMVVNYLTAIWIEDSKTLGAKKAILIGTIVVDLCLLAYFKYAGFLTENLNGLFAALKVPSLNLGPVHLPLGISFFIFHSLSYVVDVFRGTASAQRNPFNMGLYISLFPQLVAGPIVRYHDVCDQLTERTHNLDKFAEGIRRFVTGLGKKMLIANALAIPTDKIFQLPHSEITAPLAWLGAICYTFQIYFDFSGYSDMAVGLGLLFGFKLPENFNHPYSAKSMREFWQRWHMSLSNWFRDYLYIPLGGNKVSSLRTCLNLLIVFFLCGLWHGANWQFVAWGLYHGTFLGAERLSSSGLKNLESSLPSALSVPWTVMQHLYVALAVVFGWVLFRAESFPQAMVFYKAMLGYGPASSNFGVEAFLTSELACLLLVAVVFSLPLRDFGKKVFANFPVWQEGAVSPLRNAWAIAIFSLSTLEVASGTYNPFIYFRF